MISVHVLVAFTLLSFVAAAMPGPDNIYIASQGAARGFRAGFVATLGIMSGVMVHITIASAGLTTIFATSVAAFEVLRWLGVFYLCYLAFRIALSVSSNQELQSRAANYKQIFMQGLLTNLLNPKIIMFFLALLPQFINVENGNVPMQTAILGFIIMGTAFIVFNLVNLFVSYTSTMLVQSIKAQKIQNRVFATLLGGSALLLAFADRK